MEGIGEDFLEEGGLFNRQDLGIIIIVLEIIEIIMLVPIIMIWHQTKIEEDLLKEGDKEIIFI